MPSLQSGYQSGARCCRIDSRVALYFILWPAPSFVPVHKLVPMELTSWGSMPVLTENSQGLEKSSDPSCLATPRPRPVCGELLILGKSVIRHTQAKTVRC